MRKLALVVLTALAVVLLGGTASAKSISPKAAQNTGDGLVAAPLPSAPGQGGICDTKTQSGFFDKKKMYLASCATTDGSFQYIVIVNASNGSLDENSPYLEAQINTACAAQGAFYAVGVKGKFVAIYLGTGSVDTPPSAALVARGLRDNLAGELKSTKGHVTLSSTCANGKVLTQN